MVWYGTVEVCEGAPVAVSAMYLVLGTTRVMQKCVHRPGPLARAVQSVSATLIPRGASMRLRANRY